MIEFDTRRHGAVPFWFWNGDQREDELTRQLEQVAAAGFRGLAIHARAGNRTAYLSERWLALCRHCCEEALRLGLEIWLYDEEGFPSGSAGGRLAKEWPGCRHKALRYDYRQGREIAALENLVAVYDAATMARIYPSTQIPKYPSTQVPKYPNTQVPKYPSTQIPKYPSTQIPKHPTACGTL